MKKLLVSPSARWVIVALIAVVALTVAIWPRNSGDGLGPASPASPSAGQGFPGVKTSPEDMAKAREVAALEACPQPTGPAPQGAALAGVVVRCLADGSAVDLGAALAGTPTVINIWAYWCQPCRQELPVFADFAKRAGSSVRVLTVQGQSGAENPYLSLQLLSEVGVRLPGVVDAEGKVRQALTAPQLYPVTVLVRADGTVASVQGRVFERTDQLADIVRDKLGVTV